jgi:hypothetical protein
MTLKKLSLTALGLAAFMAGSAAVAPAMAHDDDGVRFGIVIGDAPSWGWDRDDDWRRAHWRHERWERERAWREREWRHENWRRERDFDRFGRPHHWDRDW